MTGIPPMPHPNKANVTTTNVVVTLSGKLDSKAEVDRAVALARAIKGVKSVDATTLTVKPRS